MELGRIERTKGPVDVQVVGAVTEAKKLVDGMFRTVRDLALGLVDRVVGDVFEAFRPAAARGAEK